MPGSRQTYEDLFDMPAGLRTFLLSPEFEEADKILQKSHGLSDDQTSAMGDKIMDAVFNTVSLPQAVVDLKIALVPSPIPEDKWKNFLSDFLKLELWPIRELFGDEMTSVLAENQIGTGGWPPFKVPLKPLTYSGAATEVAGSAGFSIVGPQQRERLRDLIMSRIKNVRTDAQVREMLMRSADFGGLGLDAATADKALAIMDQLIKGVQIMSEDEYAALLSQEARKKAEPAARAKTPDEEEIEKIRAAMPARPEQPQGVLEDSVAKTYAGLTYKPADEYLANRLKHIISSRFRDVRSAFELQQLLLRDSKVGGMGLEKTLADGVSAQIEAAYKNHHSPIMDEEKQKLEKQIGVQKQKIDDRRKREAEEHAKWYQDRILSKRKEEETQKELAERLKATMLAFAPGSTTKIEMHPVDLKGQKKETERFGEMVPAVAAGAAPIMAGKTVSREPLTVTIGGAPTAAPAVPPPLPAGRIARPEVKVSVETAKLQAAAPMLKPRVEDVTTSGAQRLVGLAEEIRKFSIAEFRRLGKDPEAAAKKIFQKIEILGQESFGRRMEGIKAWQGCPLQKEYVMLVSEAFRKGKSVTDLANDKRAAGEDALTPAEIGAIISLNSKLHY